MLITNNEDYYWDAKRFADRGKPFNMPYQGNMFLGLNYRMTELDAVIGRCQLKKLPLIVTRRRDYVKKVVERIAELRAVRLYQVIDGVEPSWWYGLLRVEEEMIKVSKDDFARAVREEGVPCGGPYNTIIAEQSFIRDRKTFGRSGAPWTCHQHSMEYSEPQLPNARKAINKHMAFRVHECLTEREADDFAEALAKVESEYLK